MMSALKTTLKRVGDAEQLLRIEVPTDRVVAHYDVVYRTIQKKANIPGYRKGKAPRNIIEQHHAHAAREEVIRQLISDTVEEAVKAHDVAVVGRVAVSDVELADQGPLIFQATIEVAPTFKLGKYKQVGLQRQPVVVTDEDVQQVLTRLQESHAEEVPVEGQEHKEKRVPELDDDFAKTVGLGSLDELRSRIRDDVTAQKAQEVERQLQEGLFEALLKKHTFDVPTSLVERRTEQLKRDYLRQLMMQGVQESDLAAQLRPMEAQLAANALKLVKLSFIMGAVAAAEEITVTAEDVQQYVESLAQRWRVTVDEVREHVAKEGAAQNMHNQLLHDKAVAWLVEHAKIS